jgi:DNA-binding sugar fermentation-stimulating protein
MSRVFHVTKFGIAVEYDRKYCQIVQYTVKNKVKLEITVQNVTKFGIAVEYDRRYYQIMQYTSKNKVKLEITAQKCCYS